MSQMITDHEVVEMREALSDVLSTLVRVSPRCAELALVRRAKELVYRSEATLNEPRPQARDWHLTGSD